MNIIVKVFAPIRKIIFLVYLTFGSVLDQRFNIREEMNLSKAEQHT